MKHMFAFFGVLILAAVGVSWAQTTPVTPTVRQILVECPDWDHGMACPRAVREFLAARTPPTDQTDRQIGSLAVQLVGRLEGRSNVPMDVCMDVAAGINILSKAMKSAGQTRALEHIALELCNDTVQTAATNPPGNANGGNGNGGNGNGGGGNENGGGGGNQNGGGGNGNGGNGNGGNGNGGNGNGGNGNGGNGNGGNGNGGGSSSSSQSSSESSSESSSSSQSSSSSSSEEGDKCPDGSDKGDDGNCGNGNDGDRCDGGHGPGCESSTSSSSSSQPSGECVNPEGHPVNSAACNPSNNDPISSPSSEQPLSCEPPKQPVNGECVKPGGGPN